MRQILFFVSLLVSHNTDIFRGIHVGVSVGLSIMHLIATAFKWFSSHDLFILS